MKLLPFAYRNLLRNKRRSILAAASVFLSILLVMFMAGFLQGFMDSMVMNYIKNETGHINIATQGYRERAKFLPVDEYIESSGKLANEVADALSAIDPQAVTAQRIRFGLMLSSDAGTKEALAVAGDPELERRMLMLDTKILPGGKYLDAPGSVILGEGLARDLALKEGDTLKLLTQKADGGLGFKKLTIAGIFKTGVNALDGFLLQLRLEDAQALLGIEDGSQQIAVMLSSQRLMKKALESVSDRVKELASANPSLGLSVLPWTAIGSYPSMIQLLNIMYYWVFIFVAFLGAFIIANVMTMVILERKREIGLLMAMGMPRKQVLRLFLAEGTMIGLAGSIAGTLVGALLVSLVGIKGFDLTSAMAGFSWPMDNRIHPYVSGWAIVLGIIIGSAVSALIAYLPSKKASKMSPVAAIKAL
ncbi:MAG: FtsX-like permease family protein [Spirochaetia bacterium]|jgi:putative ABC transport system permease protein|nr:FtsX-like permease family protein [Spirochaetia bacterium]